MPIGIPELIVLSPLLSVFVFAWGFRKRTKRLGYPSIGAYLRAVPRTNSELHDGADLAMKGLVFCFLGVIFPPLVLIGLVPLFYGGRKVVCASLGLGLVDDATESPRE